MNDDENWAGGFYELYLVLGPADDDNLDRAVRALWRAAGVDGCRVDGVDRAELVDVEPGAAALIDRRPLIVGERVARAFATSRTAGGVDILLHAPALATTCLDAARSISPTGARRR